MSKFVSLRTRIKDLEVQVHAGMTRSKDEDGNEVWISGSGLSLFRAIMKGHLSQEYIELARVWSRAENDHSGLSKIVIAASRDLVVHEA